ncbi:MAG: single-stranded DNA-binding protein [Oscillospiraceae bacterium]|nr:single-stranded DNA-binding protein [Oscillospiraceae bacterium]
MNKAILIGRLTRDPDVRKSNDTMVARYTLAVDRFKDGADFISCVAFGKSAEFADKYLKKGTKIAVTGHIQTGSYENREGQKVYTTDVIVETHEFVEPKNKEPQEPMETPDDFVAVPDDADIDGLPFN